MPMRIKVKYLSILSFAFLRFQYFWSALSVDKMQWWIDCNFVDRVREWVLAVSYFIWNYVISAWKYTVILCVTYKQQCLYWRFWTTSSTKHRLKLQIIHNYCAVMINTTAMYIEGIMFGSRTTLVLEVVSSVKTDSVYSAKCKSDFFPLQESVHRELLVIIRIDVTYNCHHFCHSEWCSLYRQLFLF